MICVGSSLWSRNSSQYYAQRWSSLPHGTRRRARFFWSPPGLDVVSPFVPHCFHIISLLFIEICPQTHLNDSQFKAAVLYSLLFYREDTKSISLWAKVLGFKQKISCFICQETRVSIIRVRWTKRPVFHKSWNRIDTVELEALLMFFSLQKQDLMIQSTSCQKVTLWQKSRNCQETGKPAMNITVTVLQWVST